MEVSGSLASYLLRLLEIMKQALRTNVEEWYTLLADGANGLLSVERGWLINKCKAVCRRSHILDVGEMVLQTSFEHHHLLGRGAGCILLELDGPGS